MRLFLLLLGLAVPVAAWAEVPLHPAAHRAAGQGSEAEPDEEVARLIEQLGSEQFASRERAQAELRRLGLRAFEALDEAQFHEDIEIALRVRHLLGTLQIEWTRDSDSAEVKRILRGYGQEQAAERKTRMEQLARLDKGQGLPALCRLARFEPDKRLSKQAALLVMGHGDQADSATRAQLAQTLAQSVRFSRRPAAQWLATYGRTLQEPLSTLDQWERLATEEQQALTRVPQSTSRQIVRDLLRWQAELLRRLEQNEQAVAVIRRSIHLLEGNREQLLDTTDWLLQQQAWEVVRELAERFSQGFQEHAELLYRLAEAQLRGGDPETGQQTAEQAWKLSAGQPQDQIVLGYSLQSRGLFEWSQREYRQVIDEEQAGSLHSLRASFLLSELLHDIQQDREAALVLQGVVDAADQDDEVEQTIEKRMGRDAGSVRSRMHYFYSRHQAAQGDLAKQREHLQQGVQADPTDADLLIAMYRLPESDQAWRKQTLQYVGQAAQHFLNEIDQVTAQAQQATSDNQREWFDRQLATLHNQYAWLIGNTEGDYQQAVRFSHKSLELRPDMGGYLDTLARCYFALGDLENALKYQTRAVQLEPHSGQIRRQLELFQQAQAEAEAEGSM